MSEQAENEIKPECKHEWEETGAQECTASSGVDNKNLHSVAHNDGNQDEKCARDLSRAAHPETKNDICENGKEHVWVETGRHASATADYQVVFHDTYLKCKLCGAEAVRPQTEYQFH